MLILACALGGLRHRAALLAQMYSNFYRVILHFSSPQGALVQCPGVAAGTAEHCLCSVLRLLPSFFVLLGMWHGTDRAEFSSYKVGINMSIMFFFHFFPH